LQQNDIQIIYWLENVWFIFRVISNSLEDYFTYFL
jgi:hypothetical protein